MTGTSINPETYAFTLTDDTTEPGDYTAPAFSDGVTYDATTGLITVPAGVTSFTITTPTVADANVEGSEAYDITVGGVAATGTITDASTVAVDSVTPDSAAEGADLVHTVTMTGTSINPRTHSAFTLTDRPPRAG